MVYMEKRLDEMVFKSLHPDTDAWIISEKKTDDYEYYKCVFMYVDDNLAIPLTSRRFSSKYGT